MHYGETKGELDIFDEILSVEDTQATEFLEERQKELCKNHISASLSSGEIDEPHPSPVFHEGDDLWGLRIAAHVHWPILTATLLSGARNGLTLMPLGSMSRSYPKR